MRILTFSTILAATLLTSCSTDTKSPEESTTTETATIPAAPKPAIANTKDPICGMPVTAADVTAYADYEGKKMGFCSEGCAEEFKKDPAKYAAAMK